MGFLKIWILMSLGIFGVQANTTDRLRAWEYAYYSDWGNVYRYSLLSQPESTEDILLDQFLLVYSRYKLDDSAGALSLLKGIDLLIEDGLIIPSRLESQEKLEIP